MSQFQYRNKNQNFISNFVFQFIKKNDMAFWVHGFFIFLGSRSICYKCLTYDTYIFSFTGLNKRRIFLLRCVVWLSSFYIRENVHELSSVKKKIIFMNSFVSKKIHSSYLFSVSKVKNNIFRFCHYIWCTFYFFINKNAKIKTNKNVDFQLFINDK